VTFKDADGRPAVREERPKAQCPVKECKGTAERYEAKNDGRLFWKCVSCGNIFDDAEGKPVIREKKEKGEVKNVKNADSTAA
jgi:Zn-finger protein